LIPPAVAAEFKRNLPNEKLPDWISIHELTARSKSEATRWVKNDDANIGEAEAIALTLQQRADWMLTDDAQARKFGESLGLEVHGSIGLLLWGVASGLVENREQAYRILNGLKLSSLWISDRVATAAAKAIDDLSAK
jgi:predicted nucleic acid-binding protein